MIDRRLSLAAMLLLACLAAAQPGAAQPGAAQPGAAQPGAAQPGADPAVSAEVPLYMEATGKVALLNNQIEALRQTAIVLMADSQVPPDRRAAFVDRFIMPDLRGAAPGLLAQWAAIYAADISLEDMKATEAFFATSAGQHLLATEQQIANSLRDVTVAWEQATVHAAFTKHQDELRSAALLHE